MERRKIIEQHKDSILNIDWSFRKKFASIHLHGIHPYPAMMHPFIPKNILKLFGNSVSTVLDPFCGSGTVLLESKLQGKYSVGVDINPLAILITEVKLNPPKRKEILEFWKNFKDRLVRLFKEKKSKDNIELPNIPNLLYWFKENIAKDLTILREIIFEEGDLFPSGRIEKFFKVCFGFTTREVSNIRKGEYKLYRISEEQLKHWNPDVLKTFINIVEENIKKLLQFYELYHNPNFDYTRYKVVEGDTKKLNMYIKEKFDIMITSPPYGDSKTTVAYGDFSKYELLWLGYPEHKVKLIDKISLGGMRSSYNINIEDKSSILSQTIKEIAKNDKNGKRVQDTKNFFIDLFITMKEIDKVMNPDGILVYVISNRLVRRVRIPTNIILREFAKDLGWEHILSIPRDIPIKRLPLKNAPENIPGLKAETMSKEFIEIFVKL